jgi:hypothetical protein
MPGRRRLWKTGLKTKTSDLLLGKSKKSKLSGTLSTERVFSMKKLGLML